MTSQCPPQKDAYRDLSQIFATRDGRVLEIEILPPALGPFLQDGCSIGITKKYLVQAFVTARQVFFSTLKATSSLDYLDDDVDAKLTVASEIILLFDCEHLTACNWRKRRLTALLSPQGTQTDTRKHEDVLSTELSLLTTYLCSPLHRHTKSPTIWQHRLWVLTQLIRLREPNFHPQAAEELIQTELSVVLRAGELHPRNYYAFSYMRQIHRVLSECESESATWTIRLAQSIITPTSDWCLAHPTDISGLMFLFYLLDAVPDTTVHRDTVSKVARFALDIGWEGEGVWKFVDLAVREFNFLDVGDNDDSLRAYPWDVLIDRDSVQSSRRAHLEREDRTRLPWKALLDKAREYWVRTRQSQ